MRLPRLVLFSLFLVFPTCYLHSTPVCFVATLVYSNSTHGCCSNTVFWCAISLASSAFNFFSNFANKRQSCLLYSGKVQNRSCINYLMILRISFSFRLVHAHLRRLVGNCVFLRMCTSCTVPVVKCTRPTNLRLNCSLPYFSNTLLFAFLPNETKPPRVITTQRFLYSSHSVGYIITLSSNHDSMSASSTSCKNASSMSFHSQKALCLGI